MNSSDKVKLLQKEIDYINDENLKNDAIYLVSILPDYFFEVDASSTGKYHPKYASGDKGLLRHVKAAVKMAVELLANPIIEKPYSSRDKDLIVLALIVHDGLKYGKNKTDKYTKFEHPILISDYIKEVRDNLQMTDEDVEKLCSMVASHMGPWNTNSYSSIVLPLPKAPIEKFVHMCDYLASRRFINIDFDSDNNLIDESKIN